MLNDNPINKIQEKAGFKIYGKEELQKKLKEKYPNIIAQPKTSDSGKKQVDSDKLKKEIVFMEQFKISKYFDKPKCENIQESAVRYFNESVNCKGFENLYGFVGANSNINSMKIIKDHLDEYKEDMLEKIERIRRFNISERKELSKNAMKKACEYIENCILDIVRVIYDKLIDEDSNSIVFSNLLKLINRYLAEMGFYTYDDNIKAGISYDELEEEVSEMFEFKPVETSKRELNKIINRVERFPYVYDYYDRDNRIRSSYIKGILWIFTSRGV